MVNIDSEQKIIIKGNHCFVDVNFTNITFQL